ncbi:hypothetical protein [Celeribacter sp.]|uniref:hypothetical protein n=1 Tax=Celeribacter sp. TaxID=1890673 RepID=UPI003A925F6E
MHSIVDNARNWSSLFTRLGMGVLILWCLDIIGFFPNSLSFSNFAKAANIQESLLKGIIFLIFAVVIGSIGVDLGQWLQGQKYSNNRLTRLAYDVGETQNILLIERMRDAQNKFELSAGLIGTICLCLAIVIISSIIHSFGDSTQAASCIDPCTFSKSERITTIISGGFGGLTSQLINKSAKLHIDSLYEVIEETKREADKE